jgi:hypothetical protein
VSDDKLWVVYERPRWMLGFMRHGDEFDATNHRNLGYYLCSIGSLDVFRTATNNVRVARDPELGAGHNYTMVRRGKNQDQDHDHDVPLYLTDGDVVPTPFEMCALYQMAHLLWDKDWRPDLTDNRV